MSDNYNEIWLEITEYDGIYLISNKGRVKSIGRVISGKNNSKYFISERILKNSITKRGYYKISLRNGNQYKTHSVHRLVAKTFIPNINNKTEVNHIDGNKLNNCVENLEWASSSENQIHAYKNNLQIPTWLNKKGKDNYFSKPILQLDLCDNVLNRFECLRDACDKLNIKHSGHINECVNGKRITAYGFKWILE